MEAAQQHLKPKDERTREQEAKKEKEKQESNQTNRKADEEKEPILLQEDDVDGHRGEEEEEGQHGKKGQTQATLLGVKTEPDDAEDDARAEPLAVGIIGNRIEDEQEQPTETPSYTGGGVDDENASPTSDARLAAKENDSEKEATKDPYQSLGSEEEDVGQQPAPTPWLRRLQKQFKSRMQNSDEEDVTPPPPLPPETAMLQIPKSESSEDDEARKKKRCFLLWVSKNY